jgi:subtilase family serine protease
MKKTRSQMAAGLALLFLSVASVAAAERQVLRDHVPAAIAKLNLQPVGRLPATNRLHLGISLPLRNNEALGQLLKGIYDPANPNFHRYLTPGQFNEKFGPAEADYQAVIRFARANGFTVTHTVPGRSFLDVEAAVPDIEKALHVILRQYQHPTEARRFFAPDVEPSLDLEVPVLAISGLNDYEKPHSRSHSIKGEIGKPKGFSYNDPKGGTLAMGSDFRHAFAPDTTNTGSGQVVGLFEYNGYTPGDITAYENTANLPNVPVQDVLLGTVTKNNPDNGDLEPPLDIEMAIAMAPGLLKVVFYHGSDIDGILTEMADPTQDEPLPRQISSCWGSGVDAGTSNCFARLAAQGQSYFYASGDSGALPVDPNGPGGTYINGASVADLEPYMTQVGGTDLTMYGAGASWESETVWGASGPNLDGGPGGSSGGIQTTIPIPDYQKLVNMIAVGGSETQRNVPDVAMPANYILDVCTDTNGVQDYAAVGGTSCSAPLWAAFTALANQQAEAQGKPYVGFINPSLYNIAQGPLYTNCFHDITNGNNTWSNSPSSYYAAVGYDLCTGWGSPTGANLINALVGYSGPIFVDFNYTGPASNGGYDGPGSYDYPYKTLALGVNAVSNGGTIIIKTAGSSSETMTITKRMTITASDGAATVGQ